MVVAVSPFEGIEMYPCQKRLMADEARVIVVCWHRQLGKDFTSARKAVRHAIREGEPWYIVSLTQRQANATFEKCKDWARHYAAKFTEYERTMDVQDDAEIGESFQFKSRELVLPNGGKVVSLPGRSPDALAGLTGNVIFTEFGLFPNGGYDHWRVVFPLTTRGHSVIVISTPRGKETKFYELLNDPDTYSVHRCNIHQSTKEGFALEDQNGNPTDVETFKRLYGDDIGFKREYECQFMGALDALIKWAQLEAAAAAGKDMPFELIELQGDSDGHALVDGDIADRYEIDFKGRAEIGWDVARRGHLSALWINQSSGDRRHLRTLVLMRNCNFEVQRNVVRSAMRLPGAVGCGDATGLGMDSNETLEAEFPGHWEGVNFGGKRKSDLGSGLATAFRDGAQTLPGLDAHKFIATDLYAVQRDAANETKAGPDGKSTLKLVESQNPLLPESHCDIAYAAALALRAGHVTPGVTPRMEILV